MSRQERAVVLVVVAVGVGADAGGVFVLEVVVWPGVVRAVVVSRGARSAAAVVGIIAKG
jgi:hypothetical protein